MAINTKTELKDSIATNKLTKQLLINMVDSFQNIELDSQIEGAKILFLFAHPDDEQYCAGIIQKVIENGHTPYVVYTTSGQNGTDVTGTYISGSTALRDAREAEGAASLLSLGVDALNIYPLRADATSLDVQGIKNEINTRLNNDGVDIDFIFTFDNVGIYRKNEHYVCMNIAMEYFRETSSVKCVYYFTIPVSDIDDLDITDVGSGSNAISDSLVDFYLPLTAPQVIKKLAILDFHVTQYIDPNKTTIKNHYIAKPYEYISFGALSATYGTNTNQEDYLRRIIG